MRYVSLLLLCCLLLGSFGCASYVPTRRFEYDPIPVSYNGRVDGALIVQPFKDDRPPRYYPNLQGRIFLSYIPLLPYVKVPYERLDESAMLHEKKKGRLVDRNAHFTRLIARTIAQDLAQANLFEEVYYDHGENVIATEYVLSGELRSTEFDYYVSSYMLGMPGVLLWLLPVPMGSNHAHIEANLYLRDREGNLLWKHTLMGEGKKWFLAYTSGGAALSSKFSLEIARYGKNDEGVDGDSVWAYHALALRSGMEEAKRSLAAFLEQQQAN